MKTGDYPGFASPFQLVGNAFGPLLAGLAFDLTGSYFIILALYIALMVLGGLLVLLATPPQKPAAEVY